MNIATIKTTNGKAKKNGTSKVPYVLGTFTDDNGQPRSVKISPRPTLVRTAVKYALEALGTDATAEAVKAWLDERGKDYNPEKLAYVIASVRAKMNKSKAKASRTVTIREERSFELLEGVGAKAVADALAGLDDHFIDRGLWIRDGNEYILAGKFKSHAEALHGDEGKVIEGTHLLRVNPADTLDDAEIFAITDRPEYAMQPGFTFEQIADALDDGDFHKPFISTDLYVKIGKRYKLAATSKETDYSAEQLLDATGNNSTPQVD